MTLRTLKIFLFISAALISISMTFAFLTPPLLGSIFLSLIKSVGADLPRLTSDYALPMLRVDPALPDQRPVNIAWVLFCWGAIIVTPLLIMIWSVKAETLETCVARWICGILSYLPLVMILFIPVISGLLIAVAPFPNMVLS